MNEQPSSKKPVWEFDRYVNGRLMAEGIVIERAETREHAFAKASQMAYSGDVLVLRAAAEPCPSHSHPSCPVCNPNKTVPELNRASQPPSDALALAIRFHETYERLAPSFGYETRPDTRAFDPESKNGRLMVAVCAEIGAAVTKPVQCQDSDGCPHPDRCAKVCMQQHHYQPPVETGETL